ncbi:MAG TPA: hypothetical protein VGD87_06330, partial [Archangium sp.]
AHLSLAWHVAMTRADYPQGPVLFTLTLATMVVMSLTGTLTFSRWRALRSSTPSDERLFSLVGATLSPLFLLACLGLFVALLRSPPSR